MSFSDSMFLLEIVVENLTSYIDCKEFCIKSKFADVFKLNLKDPNDLGPPKPRRRPKRRIKVRDDNVTDQKPPVEGKVQSGQSVLFTSPIDTLIATMKNYPIEITLFNKDDHRKKVGSVHVPWSPLYIDYLYLLATKVDPAPIIVNVGHNVYDDNTSRRIATISLNIKLTHLRDKLTSYGRSLSVPTPTKNTKILYHSIFKPKKYAAAPVIIDPGTIKTVYGGGKRKKKSSSKSKTNNSKPPLASNESKMIGETKADVNEDLIEDDINRVEKTSSVLSIQHKRTENIISKETKASLLHLVKSDNDFSKKVQDDIVRTKSCSSINRKCFKFSNYIFGDTENLLRNKVLCVGYFTVENEFTAGGSSKPSSSNTANESAFSPKEDAGDDCDCRDETRGPFRICDKDCTKRKEDDTCISKRCEDDAKKISIIQCDKVNCNILEKRKLPLPPDTAIHLDLTSLKQKRLEDLGQAVENVVGGMKAKMKIDEKSCYCECECTFGFVKRTTYCSICGGYEKPGEDLSKTALSGPFPCPIYHKLIDKNKQKSTSGSDRSKTCDSIKGSNKKGKPPPVTPAVNVESDKEFCRKKKKEKKDDRFKFNYGYTAPQIGHSKCAMPCTGTLNAVPKSMGWLWTADDVPGMKFRPSWKPGCVHKHVLHLLRMAKDPGIVLAKKKKKPEKQKRPLKRPLLTVAKKDGEYTVTMETMKAYSKPRALNQQPYEDKPVLTYTIGRTEEENRERRKKKEREQRRLQREQRAFIQSAFADMCKDICLKTYQQALGFLPDTETPDCSCYPNHPGAEDTNLDRSCSCSEHDVSFGSDTDSDEWLVEFTPPNAHFDPTFKPKKIFKQDRESQYTYLDYRVKLLDKSGNQVVRFFKGPDGKPQCSDLGGFWSPDHTWLEINVDGFIGPDGRWAPMTFIGPHGDTVDCETGKFQDVDGTWLTVGVDGYVDAAGKWKWYKQKCAPQKKSVKRFTGDSKKDDKKAVYKPSETTWSCFGDANPTQLSKLGILGHGQDKKLLLQRLTDMLQHGKNVKIPEPSMIPRVPASKRGKRKDDTLDSSFYSERIKCKHAMPSDKGIVAVDGHGNKTYFRVKDYINTRPAERLANLTHQGISTNSFHLPCFSSFTNGEMLRKQQYERFLKNQPSKYSDMEYGTGTASKDVATQINYRYRYAI